MPDDRNDWQQAMVNADLLFQPLAPPLSCSRCLRPLEPEKRHWGTCWQCGHEHPPTLSKISAVTYGATGTRPWDFYLRTKFENDTAEHVESFVNGIAATLSLLIEQDYGDFSGGDDEHIVVPLPSSSGLIGRCIAAINDNSWPSVQTADALTAAIRPKQTGQNMDGRREAAAGKYTAAATVTRMHVLLLDDAYTSGYSLHDAARAVAHAGSLSVGGVVYIRRIYPDAMALYRDEREE
jgi:hypothetical protein